MDILPRCVDKKETNGEITKGIYSEQLTAMIGEGAYDEGGHRNTQFLEATRIGPYPREMQKAWDQERSGRQLRFSGRVSRRGSKRKNGATCGAHAGYD